MTPDLILSPTEDDLRQAFPALNPGEFEITSPEDSRYNCIAWAAGDANRWWEPSGVGGHYWPPTLPVGSGASTLLNYIAAYKTLGFVECNDDQVEQDVDKVAVFAVDEFSGFHAARQLPNGTWASKLGGSFDIEHRHMRGVEGTLYGSVRAILKRARPS